MRGTLLIFRPRESPPEARHVDFTVLSDMERLDAFKDAIGGGYIEVVPHFTSIEHDGARHKCVAFCDEDGKRKRLDFNHEATALWDTAMRRAAGCGCHPDFLVGPVVVVFGDPEFMEAL